MLFNASFFERNQKRLLQIANSRFLRWVLGLNRLPKTLKDWKIEKITPDAIHRRIVNGKTFKIEWQAAIFTRNRFAEALSFNLSPFAFLQIGKMRAFRFSPVGAIGVLTIWFLVRKGFDLPWYTFPLLGTVDTIYPNGSDTTVYYTGSASWATTHDAAAGTGTDTTQGYAIGKLFSGTYRIYRWFSKFNVAGINDITAVILAVYGNEKAGSGSSANAYGSTAADTITTDDYDQGGTTAYCDSPIGVASWSTSGYNSFAFNATGISAVDGSATNFKCCLRQVENDVANSSPSLDCNIGFLTSSASGTSQDPYIQVTYGSVVATTVTPQNNLAMLGVS